MDRIIPVNEICELPYCVKYYDRCVNKIIKEAVNYENPSDAVRYLTQISNDENKIKYNDTWFYLLGFTFCSLSTDSILHIARAKGEYVDGKKVYDISEDFSSMYLLSVDYDSIYRLYDVSAYLMVVDPVGNQNNDRVEFLAKKID